MTPTVVTCKGILQLEAIFIIHPCDPAVVICYLIWLCDMAM